MILWACATPGTNRRQVDDGATLEMDDFDCAPMRLKIFSHEPPMAVFRLVFAAKQTAAVENFLRHRRLYSAPLQQFREGSGIVLPTAIRLFVRIEQFLRRRELRQMGVLQLANRAQKIFQI